MRSEPTKASLHTRLTSLHSICHPPWLGRPKDLIRKLLLVDPRHCLSAQQALAHPWMSCEPSDAPLPTTKSNLRRRYNTHEFRAVVSTVIATNRWGLQTADSLKLVLILLISIESALMMTLSASPFTTIDEPQKTPNHAQHHIHPLCPPDI